MMKLLENMVSKTIAMKCRIVEKDFREKRPS